VTRPRVYTWDAIASALCVASPKTARSYASRPFDPLRVWRLCGRVYVERCRADLWRDRQRAECIQPRLEGLLALGDSIGIRDDEALLKLIRRAVDPLPTWYDGRRIVAWASAVEDWCEWHTEHAVEPRAEAETDLALA
jgi:hypothetical protein